MKKNSARMMLPLAKVAFGVFVLTSLSACEPKGDTAASEKGEDPKAAPGESAAEKAAAEKKAKEEAEKKAEEEARKVPALDRGPLDVEKIKEGKAADKAGDEFFDAGELEKAEKEYRRALSIDAGNIFARYNLARTLARTKKVEEATEVILSIDPKDCPLCVKRLIAATVEKDFAEVQKDPAFIKATKDVHKSLLKFETAMKEMEPWLKKMVKKDALPDNLYLDPRSTIVLEDRTVGAKRRYTQLHGSEHFRSYLRETFPGGVAAHGPKKCSAGCCKMVIPTKLMTLARNMCFEQSGTSAVRLKKIVIEGDPGFFERSKARSDERAKAGGHTAPKAKGNTPAKVRAKSPPKPQ